MREPRRPIVSLELRSLALVASLQACVGALLTAQQESWKPDVPRTWDPQALATLELPNAVTGKPAKHVDAAFYHAIPEQVIYRTFPVYHPDAEPPGYREGLEKVAPEVTFDASRLVSRADWVAAGEQVFHWPIGIVETTAEGRARFREQLAKVPLPKTRDGVLPFYRYVVRKQGVVEFGRFSCAMCHSRVMPDGSVILGAQGNLPFDQEGAVQSAGASREQLLGGWTALFGMPARDGVPGPFPADITAEQMVAALAAIPG